ncbi:hypothetical protein ACU40P_03540 [Staphylococcus arlettae]
MVKIKQKKTMNLPQLVEWGFNNAVKNQSFLTHDNEGNTSEVYFNIRGLPKFSSMVDKSDTFTVETYEEITEDTELDLVERFIGGTGCVCYTSHKMSIKECLERTPRDCTTTHFYIENDDRELVLIWRDGRLVD